MTPSILGRLKGLTLATSILLHTSFSDDRLAHCKEVAKIEVLNPHLFDQYFAEYRAANFGIPDGRAYLLSTANFEAEFDPQSVRPDLKSGKFFWLIHTKGSEKGVAIIHAYRWVSRGLGNTLITECTREMHLGDFTY